MITDIIHEVIEKLANGANDVLVSTIIECSWHLRPYLCLQYMEGDEYWSCSGNTRLFKPHQYSEGCSSHDLDVCQVHRSPGK